MSLASNESFLVDGERVIRQGTDQLLVASKSAADEWHTVEWDDEAHEWTCTCMGFQCRRRCRHARAISRLAGGLADVRLAREEE